VDAHLAMCGACREWHSLLVQLERHVPFIPVPPSKHKSQLLHQLLKNRQDAAAATLPVMAAQTLPQMPIPNSSRKWMIRAGLAASILVLVLSAWLVHASRLASSTGQSDKTTDALLARLTQRDQRLANAVTPGERIVILADLAERLQEETQTSSANGAQLMALALLYDEVVREGILKQAESLPAKDRLYILGPIAERLDQAANRVEQIYQNVPAEYTQPLQTIAAAAHEGHNRLRALLPESRA